MSDKKYKTVLIVGNGFDINLGLKTQYQDFINSSEFENALDGNELCQYLKTQYEVTNWIDIENELKKYSKDIYKDDLNRKRFRLEYNLLCDCLCLYLNRLNISDINLKSKAYKFISDKLADVEFLTLNFNYTESVNHISKLLGLNNEIIKVHGSSNENRIVFGVEDSAQINKKDVFLKKSTCDWNKVINIDEYISEATSIIFWGYSLGETDHHYFTNFFQSLSRKFGSPSRKNILITHFREDGKYEIYEQLDSLTIRNINQLRINHNLFLIDISE